MIAYSVLTGAGERLFVSYSENSPDGVKLEKSEIINEIKEIDKSAFISVSTAMSVYGEGFEEIKTGLKMKISKKEDKNNG